MRRKQLARRKYKEDVRLSILGLGGMTLLDMGQGSADRLVAESRERGVNYFDVAPLYGEGEAEKIMGIALAPYRRDVFLACKTMERSAAAARKELERSLRRLKTEFFDLYQFHAVGDVAEVDEIFSRRGAMETFQRARRQGKIRYIGFSAHTVEAALAMLDHYPFDSLLFPVNFVCYAQGHFGPQVMARARERKTARLAIKAMAHGPWGRTKRRYPNCWYRPVDDRQLARQALRFALGEGVTAASPPGDERLFRLALDLAGDLSPMTAGERRELLAGTRGMKPLLRA
jgi:aryl-alcohol dehydrogenase-like predicted oxidoreductase